MIKNLLLFAFIGLLVTACNDPEVQPANTSDEFDEQIESLNDRTAGPVMECDETLSAVEMLEIWEMMNAKTHHERNICFEGYVLSNETYGDLVQGSIAFKPFTEADAVIPSAYCQFTGVNGAAFLDYEVGDKIQIMGRMLTIDNPNKHNFMFSKCSLPVSFE